MKLVKTGYPDKVSIPVLTTGEKELFDIDYTAPVPRGKYKDKTLLWIKDNDKSYYTWMLDNDIIYEWRLITLKEYKVEIDKSTWLYTGNEVWIAIVEVQKSS